MLNQIAIMGRLVRDPELRRTGSGIAVTAFTLAVERDYSSRDGAQKETDFIDCVAWRKTGEFAANYFKKGAMAAVVGSLNIRKWTDKDGNKRTSPEVVVNSMYFAGPRRADQETAPAAAPYHEGVMLPAASDYAILEDEDAQLPF